MGKNWTSTRDNPLEISSSYHGLVKFGCKTSCGPRCGCKKERIACFPLCQYKSYNEQVSVNFCMTHCNKLREVKSVVNNADVHV